MSKEENEQPLVERLRWSDGWFFENPWDHVTYASDDPFEAADEIERLREALENIGNLSLNGCIKVNTPHGLWVGTPDAYAREVMGMPWRTEDPDYSNEILGCYLK